MEKPFYVGFVPLEISKLLLYETHNDKLESSLGGKNPQCHFMDSVVEDTQYY